MSLQKGHKVFLIDHNQEELQHTETVLSHRHEHGKDFSTSMCNLRRPQEIATVAEQASTFFAGHLDCLINNAACKLLVENGYNSIIL